MTIQKSVLLHNIAILMKTPGMNDLPGIELKLIIFTRAAFSERGLGETVLSPRKSGFPQKSST